MAPLDPQLERRVTRFLYTGLQEPKYFPGCWHTQKYFTLDKLNAVDAIIALDEDTQAMFDLILKAYESGLVTRYETIAFALVKCLHVGSEKLKETTYKFIPRVCKTPEELLLFTKFTKAFKTGHGAGWCKTVGSWYRMKEPMELAREVTRVKGRYGRSHQTLIRKSHVKIDENDHARDAVIKYTLFGIKKAKQMMESKPDAQDVLEYIQRVENLRHCEDPKAAATIILSNKFTFEHIPGHLLTSQEVWDAVLPQMNLGDLLNQLLRIHNMGFLLSDSTTTAIVLSLLSNKEYVKRSPVTPIHIYITLCDYKRKAKPLKRVKQKIVDEKTTRRRTKQMFDPTDGQWKWLTARRHPRENKYWGIDLPPNPAIVTALYKLLDTYWPQTPVTKKSYMLTMDMRNHMFKGRHFCKTPDKTDTAKTNDNAKKPGPKPKKAKMTRPVAILPHPNQSPATSDTSAAGASRAVTGASASGVSGEAADAGDNEFKVGKKRLLAECFFNKHVTPGHAAIVMALSLLKREKDVKIAVFTEAGLEVVQLGKNQLSIEKIEKRLRKATLGHVKLDAPLEWAIKTKARVDVFINMVDRPSRKMELPIAERQRYPIQALEQYRSKMNMPKARLVTMSLASHKLDTSDGSHEGVLDIVGIDEHVPNLIDAFAMGFFD